MYPQDYTLVIPNDTLRFSSKFESGNLKKAIKINENEYRLLLEYDTETLGYTQWYFFSVKPYKSNHKVRFNITNLMKYDSLYNGGMKPLVFTHTDYKENEKFWHRNCSDVSYYKNNYVRPDETKTFYTLTFSYVFEEADETFYFAYSYPYTYTDLINYVEDLKTSYSSILTVNPLCTTLAGNLCPVITITNDISTYNTWDEEALKLHKSAAGRRILKIRESRNYDLRKSKHQAKRGVFITARVHPGESNSSYIVKGFIDFLVSQSKEAKALRKRFIFKIIPMLNPDGVVYGNYRCSLLGIDLNRRWLKPDKVLHPTIYYSKKLLEIFTEENEVLMYCDMHGHSIKKDVFMYGCCNTEIESYDLQTNLFIRLIPYLFSLKTSLFSYTASKFRVEKNKKSTGRVVCFSQLGVVASYTLEASFYTCSNLSKNTHLSIAHLESLGKDLCSLLSNIMNPRDLRKWLKDLSFKVSGRKPAFVTPPEEKPEEYVTIKDTIKEIDDSLIENICFQDQDSGGSDLEGSDNDDKKSEYKKKIAEKSSKSHKKIRSITPVDVLPEINSPIMQKSIKTYKKILPLGQSIKDKRSLSIIKEKPKTEEKNYGSYEDTFKLKFIVNGSPIKFTRERVPIDSSLTNMTKVLASKKKTQKSNLNQKRMKLQIINIIKHKLNKLI